jgi:leader peptidase (prepilin peptidase)/N-methyltransferase
MGGLGAALIVLSVFDLVTLRLPSALNLIVAICCAGLAWSEHNLVAGLVTAAVWYGLLSLVSVVFRKRYGRDGLGAGDIKLIAALAIYGGPLMTSILVAVAASTALILVRLAPKTLGPSAKLPFGPFLAASAWCVFAIQLGAPP